METLLDSSSGKSCEIDTLHIKKTQILSLGSEATPTKYTLIQPIGKI